MPDPVGFASRPDRERLLGTITTHDHAVGLSRPTGVL